MTNQANPYADEGSNPFLFDLAGQEAKNFNGGQIRGANEDNFPILKEQQSRAYLIELEPSGIREPHWHPSAWESTFVISGEATFSVLTAHPDGEYVNRKFNATAGQLVFIPQGFFHYFANASDTESLKVLVNFNDSAPEPNDDIGIVASLAAVPDEVLDTVFGAKPGSFAAIEKSTEAVVITKHD